MRDLTQEEWDERIKRGALNGGEWFWMVLTDVWHVQERRTETVSSIEIKRGMACRTEADAMALDDYLAKCAKRWQRKQARLRKQEGGAG